MRADTKIVVISHRCSRVSVFDSQLFLFKIHNPKSTSRLCFNHVKNLAIVEGFHLACQHGNIYSSRGRTLLSLAGPFARWPCSTAKSGTPDRVKSGDFVFSTDITSLPIAAKITSIHQICSGALKSCRSAVFGRIPLPESTPLKQRQQ